MPVAAATASTLTCASGADSTRRRVASITRRRLAAAFAARRTCRYGRAAVDVSLISPDTLSGEYGKKGGSHDPVRARSGHPEAGGRGVRLPCRLRGAAHLAARVYRGPQAR